MLFTHFAPKLSNVPVKDNHSCAIGLLINAVEGEKKVQQPKLMIATPFLNAVGHLVNEKVEFGLHKS
jgi:hypothetical protein